MKILPQPDFLFERKLWRRGFKVVAGVDEVGRGCFAGPVVASAVAFPSEITKKLKDLKTKKITIDDCKRMTPRQREKANEWIKENTLSWGIGEAPVSVINRLGMSKATKMAFRRAISEANRRLGYKDTKILNGKKLHLRAKVANIRVSKYPSIQFLLVDAFFIPYVPNLPTKRRKDKKGRFRKNPNGRQQAIIDGDQKSVSIAAASIIAKVYRDRLMLSLSKQSKYKKYGWGRNKGYGTREHQEAIVKYGITRYHRKKFIETFLGNSKTKKRKDREATEVL